MGSGWRAYSLSDRINREEKMTQQTKHVLAEALGLPETERGDLAAKLIESLDAAAETDPEASWSAEIQQRLAQLDSGQVQPIAWPDARRMIMDDTDAADAADAADA
jgi:putative addiction module component (TIGR02574 family)